MNYIYAGKKTLHTVLFSFALLCAPTYQSLSAAATEQSAPVEISGFEIHDLKIHHQENDRTLNLKASFTYHPASQGPDVQQIREATLQYIRNYPSPMDYWEIMNTNLEQMLLTTYPGLSCLKMEIAIVSDEPIPFNRRSVVRYNGKDILEESFGFEIKDFKFHNCVPMHVNLDVFYHYIDNPQKSDYPDFRWIADAINQYIAQRPEPCKDWPELKQELIQHVQAQFPVIKTLDIKATLS